MLLSLPALAIEFYLEKLGRPRSKANGELISPGEDMAAAGLTEYLWDIVHATWIVLVLVGAFGEWAWWVGLVVPLYAAYLAWGLYNGFRKGQMPGMPDMGGAAAGGEQEAKQSKRQAKMEGRGGQKARYR